MESQPAEEEEEDEEEEDGDELQEGRYAQLDTERDLAVPWRHVERSQVDAVCRWASPKWRSAGGQSESG